jgi:hypothetical protein
MDIAKPYVAPELELVGEASDVVMGATSIGADGGGEFIVGDMEFETD